MVIVVMVIVVVMMVAVLSMLSEVQFVLQLTSGGRGEGEGREGERGKEEVVISTPPCRCCLLPRRIP